MSLILNLTARRRSPRRGRRHRSLCPRYWTSPNLETACMGKQEETWTAATAENTYHHAYFAGPSTLNPQPSTV